MHCTCPTVRFHGNKVRWSIYCADQQPDLVSIDSYLTRCCLVTKHEASVSALEKPFLM